MEINKVNEINNTENTAGSAGASSVSNDDFSSYIDSASKTLEDIFKQASDTYGVSVSLLEAIGKQESNFKADATSRCGAQGIMQLMPATAAGLGVTDAYDAEQNIMGGAKYIAGLLEQYNGDTSLALAAYNAGSNNVAKYGGIPPFKETQNYVEKVLGYMQTGVTLPDGTVTSGASREAEGTGSGMQPDGSEGMDTEKDPASLSDLLFTYDEYLKFLEIYMDTVSKSDEESEEEAKEEELAEKDTEDRTYYDLQGIRYNNSIMKLFNS